MKISAPPAIVFAALLALPACGEEVDPPGYLTTALNPATCPDGGGSGCDAGADCDDQDPANDEACHTCRTPREGCPCEPGAKPLHCVPDLHPDDPLFCTEGTRYCRDGAWTDCIPLYF